MNKQKIAKELVKVAKELASAKSKSNSRFTLVLRRSDFRNGATFQNILDNMDVSSSEFDFDEVELKVVGGEAF